MLYRLLTYASVVSIITPLILSILRYKALNKTLRALFMLVLLGLITEVICIYLGFNKISTAQVFSFYTFIEAILLLIIYRIESHTMFWNKLVLLLIVLFVLIFATVTIFNFSHEIINSLEAFLLLVLSLRSFLDFYNYNSETNIINSYFFWINSAVFLYFGISFFIGMFENTIRFSDLRIRQLAWSIHLVSNIIFNTLLSIGIWKAKTK